MGEMEVDFEFVSPMEEPANSFILAAEDHLTELYGAPDSQLPREVSCPPDGGHLIGWLSGIRVAGGGFTRHDERTAEIRRMYVVPEERSRGIARLLLTAIGLQRECMLNEGRRNRTSRPSITSGPMVVIDVYADVWCPFAHVGLRTFAMRRDESGRHDAIMRVRAWPLELVNGEPLDPQATAEHVRDLRREVAPDLFVGFDPQHFPRSTLPALAVAAAAYRHGDRTGEAVSLAIRDALFEQGSDISRSDVLQRIADAHGVYGTDEEDREAVLGDWQEGRSRGVRGSPHFFCGDLQAFCPALDITKDHEGRLHVERNTEALGAFLDACFRT